MTAKADTPSVVPAMCNVQIVEEFVKDIHLMQLN